jgi:hypothetical protein
MWKRQLSLALFAGLATFVAEAVAQQGPDLKAPSAFSDIADRATRSRALFNEAAKVITSPRCMNCHPAGDQPHQGDDRHVHQPLALRGEANNARAALRGVPHRQQFSAIPGRGELPKHSRQPALEFGSDRNGVGRKNAGRDMPPD